MIVLSLPQPSASLAIKGIKHYLSTRAHYELVGQRIALHALPGAPSAPADPLVLHAVFLTRGLEPASFPRGAFLGTVYVRSCHRVTDAFRARLANLESVLGEFADGRYAYELGEPHELFAAVPARAPDGRYVWDAGAQYEALLAPPKFRKSSR